MALKPRVLFLDHTGALGGAELFLMELAARWDGKREVVLFADGPLRERLEKAEVPVSVFLGGGSVASVGRGGRGLAQLLAVPAILKLAWQVARRAADFDLLFCEQPEGFGGRCHRLADWRQTVGMVPPRYSHRGSFRCIEPMGLGEAGKSVCQSCDCQFGG